MFSLKAYEITITRPKARIPDITEIFNFSIFWTYFDNNLAVSLGRIKD